MACGEKMSAAIRELFANTKVDDVVTEKATVIEIASTEDVESAFAVRRLLCACWGL